MDARQNTSERETAELWPPLQSDKVFKAFRSQFIGKSSPVHFFWGSFDLALTFFSGRRAPERPGADRMTREAYSYEVISCGFWPGDDCFPLFCNHSIKPLDDLLIAHVRLSTTTI